MGNLRQQGRVVIVNTQVPHPIDYLHINAGCWASTIDLYTRMEATRHQHRLADQADRPCVALLVRFLPSSPTWAVRGLICRGRGPRNLEISEMERGICGNQRPQKQAWSCDTVRYRPNETSVALFSMFPQSIAHSK